MFAFLVIVVGKFVTTMYICAKYLLTKIIARITDDDVRYNGRRRQSMSLEMAPEPTIDSYRLSSLAQRRVKSYDDTSGELDYDRNSITQFIRQPFPTKPTAEELRRMASATASSAAISARSRPTFSYNDTGSFEEVDEEKVGAQSTCFTALFLSSDITSVNNFVFFGI